MTMTFADLQLADPILNVLEAEGYESPTPIQDAVIPAVLAGRDVVGLAQTGTGKTAAFTLPLLDRLMRDRKKPVSTGTRMLILVPTRELAAQVSDNLARYGRGIKHRSALIVGGVRIPPQVRTMQQGVDITIATPGRLEDLMRTKAITLEHTETIVLDEADQMMDLGFMPAIQRIMGKLPEERQTVLLSATMPKPIRALANQFLDSPHEVSVAKTSSPAETVSQTVFLIDRKDKRRKLIDTLGEHFKSEEGAQAIVFTRTKRGADRVARELTHGGIEARAIHGDRPQQQRERTLKSFRKGTLGVLVATDIAARGIDIDAVGLVINFDIPNVPEQYIHRIGRTGRAGRSGRAVALCVEDERDYLLAIEKLTGQLEVIPLGDEPPFERPRKAGNASKPGRGRKPSRQKTDKNKGAPRRVKDRLAAEARSGYDPRVSDMPQDEQRRPSKADHKGDAGEKPAKKRDFGERAKGRSKDRGDREDRRDRRDRSERSGRSEHGADRFNRPQRSDRSDRSDRPRRAEYSDRPRRDEQRDDRPGGNRSEERGEDRGRSFKSAGKPAGKPTGRPHSRGGKPGGRKPGVKGQPKAHAKSGPRKGPGDRPLKGPRGGGRANPGGSA